MNLRTTLIAGLAAAVLPTAAWAQAPCAIPFQSYLVDEDGTPSDTPIDVEVTFYDGADDGAAPIDCRVFTSATVNNGWLNLSIDACSLPEPGPSGCGVMTVTEILEAGAAEGAQVYMALRLGDDLADAGPRTPLGAVPYAVYATSAQTAVTATSAATADVAAELEGFAPADYATIASLSTVATSGAFSDLTGIPDGLGDGDGDTLGALVCAAGQVAVYDDGVGGWVCGAAGGTGPVGSAFADVPPAERVELTTSGAHAHSVAAWIDDGSGYLLEVETSSFVSCTTCGDGSDGSWSLTGVPAATMPAGEYNYTEFTLGEGVELTFTGTEPVVLRVTGTAVIEGTIRVAGLDADGNTGGVAGPGGTNGQNGGSGFPSENGVGGLPRTDWSLPNNTELTEFLGGTGGGGGQRNSSPYGSGGGGGGGALAVFARAIELSGLIDASAGGPAGSPYYRGARGGGGSVWLRASHIVVDGSISVDGATDGVVRLDAHRLEHPDLDSVVQGSIADIPPHWHLYQTTTGTVTFANNGLDSVSASLSYLE